MEPGEYVIIEGTADAVFEHCDRACIVHVQPPGDPEGDIFLKFPSWRRLGWPVGDHPMMRLAGRRVQVQITVLGDEPRSEVDG